MELCDIFPVNQDGECRFKTESIGAKCTGFVDVTQGNEAALKEAVATIGPVSVGIDASQDSFMLYESGEKYSYQMQTKGKFLLF